MRLQSMLGILGLAASSVVAASMVRAPAAAAAPRAATVTPCGIGFTTLAADGTLSNDSVVGSPPSFHPGIAVTGQIDPTQTPFVAAGWSGLGGAAGEYINIVALSPVNGRIADSRYTYESETGQSSRARTVIGTSGGWDHFRLIIGDFDPNERTQQVGQWVFALHPNGRLYRYRMTYGPPERIVAAGSVAGVGNVKTLALIARRPSYDVLIGTTTSGLLLTIQVGKAATFVTHTAYLRTSTWQVFDTVVATYQCLSPNVPFGLLGIVDATHRAYLYDVGQLTGPTTSIRAYGSTVIRPGKVAGCIANETG